MPDKRLKTAKLLAQSGFCIFPLKPGTARPAIKGWQEKATTDETIIEQWFQKKQYNVGIACKTQCIVIDVDVKNGKTGMQSLKNLIAQGLPKTLTVRTPTGGLHLYFQHPGGFVIGTVGYWPGIDIRGNGGLTAAPSSVRKEGEYTWALKMPLAEWPSNIALPTAESRQQVETTTDSLILDTASKYSSIPDVVKMGERDDYLFKSACSWRERGYTKDHALALMQVLHSRCEQPPTDVYPLDDALQKVEQAWTSYNPTDAQDNWTQVVTPQGPVSAPRHEIKSMQEALNRFVLIIDGNRVADLNSAPHTAVMKLEEFKTAYRNIYVNKKELPTRWLGHRGRQTVRATMYFPNRGTVFNEAGDEYYNTYSPSQQVLPKAFSKKAIKPFLDHVRHLLGSIEDATRFLHWCAFSVQYPEKRIPWMPLIISAPRCGKGMLFQALQKVVGFHNTAKINPTAIETYLKNGFNSWMSGTLFVCIEEIKTTRKWDVTERLKDIITEGTLDINHKHGKKGAERVFSNIIAFSNHKDAMAVDKTDGRIWVVDSGCRRQSDEYYAEFMQWIESDGPAHLELFLRQLDIRDFNWASPPPMTHAKEVMIAESMSLLEQQLTDAIEDREGPFQADIIDLTVVEEFIQRQSQTPLNAKDRYQLRHLVQEITQPLAQERYRVKMVGASSGKRYRCRALRNEKHWFNAAPDAIAREFVRAWMAAQGHNIPADLKEVKDPPIEESS